MNLQERECELILFSENFQKRFHGRSALQVYLEALSKINSELCSSKNLSEKDKHRIHQIVFRGLGIFISEQELLKQREQLTKVSAQGVRFMFPGHPEYPSEFLSMNEPPFLLSYLGAPVWVQEQGLAVVGSRDINALTVSWMENHLGPCLEKLRVFVVSGGARGVDQKAHLLALAKGCPTVVFLPSGLGKVYPHNLQAFVEPVIAAGGAIVSEYSYWEPMKKHYFHARNRLISGLSVCTLITQASRKSGTLITGRQAMEQARAVFVVPSHPLDVDFQGGLDLLMDGATPVRDCQDLTLLLESELKSAAVFRRRMTAKDSEHQNENSYS